MPEENAEEVKEETVGVSDTVDEGIGQDVVETELPLSEETESLEEEISDEEIDEIWSAMGDLDFGTLTINQDELRENPVSEQEKRKIERRLERLVGKLPIKWSSTALEVLRNGAVVAGRTAKLGFELYDRLPVGTEYHEAFHRIFEILIPNSIRENLYKTYYNKFNESFKQENGRNLTDRDISEAFAEMFRHFMIDREPIQFRDLSKTFGQIKDYIQGLRNLGSRKFALLFLAANSGMFRYVKPNAKNTEHFMNALKGVSNSAVLTARIGNETKRVELQNFPDIGWKDFFNDAVKAVIYALCTNYSIDYLARNAGNIKTGLTEIQSLFKTVEKTEHSSWFRVITGEYIKDGMTAADAFTYF